MFARTLLLLTFIVSSTIGLAQSPLSASEKELLKTQLIETPSTFLAAANFSGTLVTGQEIKLEQYRGKVVFLNFWATWCAPCLREMPDMQALQESVGEEQLVVLAVGMGEDQNRVQQFLQKHPFSFKILPDPEMKVTQLYGVSNIPVTYLINPAGFVIARAMGPREWHTPELIQFFRQQRK